MLNNTIKPELSKTLNSIKVAADYLKKVEGKSDRVTMHLYINYNKIYPKKLKFIGIK